MHNFLEISNMDNYSKWIEEMTLKYPDIPVIEIDYNELQTMNVEVILGKDFTPGIKKGEPQYRDSPFAESYSIKPKSNL